MSPVIRIPDSIYSRLEKHAQGFDTPANVIEKLLNHYDGVEPPVESSQKEITPTGIKDTTKYQFENQSYGKSRLVLAVLKKHAELHPDDSYADLLELFPKEAQGSIGVFNDIALIEEKYAGKSNKRHFVKPEEQIRLSDCVVCASTEWGISNIEKFIRCVSEAGYTIEATLR